MKILLTGPTGFIGPAFIRLARSRGHQIAGLIIPSESVPSDLPSTPDLLWLRGTLQEAPWDQISSFGPDVCVHMAWITTPGIYLESPENLRFLDASISFLRKLRELGVFHIFGLGTCVEYQITNQPLSEERTPVIPTTTYARCKNELRLTMETDARQHGVVFCWGRVFYPYGPREHPSRLCSSIIQKLSRNEKIVLKTPDSTKDYIYIEDLASALLTVLEKKFSGPINLGTGIGVSVREIAHSLGEMMGKPQLIEEANPPEIDPLGFVVADASRLHQLGWRPSHDLRQGLQKLLDARA
jgi:nucleoside-diphosphate-sugar epimerase